MTKEEILNLAASENGFCFHPKLWEESDTCSNLNFLIEQGLIQKLSLTQPEYMNAEYIYVEKNYKKKMKYQNE